jgi:succinate-semialdehyde dehydrogenase/glutarate-semialdehyde dehydrogenase
MPIESVNPTTGERERTFTALTDGELDAALARAAAAAGPWGQRPLAERAGVVAHAGELLQTDAEALGRLMTREMGKLVGAARQEAEKCADGCRYYAAHAEAFLRPEVVDTADAGGRGEVRFEPLGAVLAVMPWNFPFWQVLRFAAPALVAGNVALLKHASNVPQCALALEELFQRAGAPRGVFQTLLIGADRVAGVIADDRVAAVTVTGSEAAGREVATAAGRALKKSVLELGGSDPFIVLPSADLARAVATAVKARMVNAGQSCIAAKRFIVAEAIYEPFAAAFVAAMQALRVGDPMDPATEVGPLATAAIVDGLDGQVRRSLAAGAKALTGGRRIAGPGNFYEPTVLADIPEAAPAFGEELFGPVASLFRVPDVDVAIALANATSFGLGASAWTRDAGEIARLTRELQAGSVFINDMVASDARFPFGGVKRSGHGRELGLYGLREFVNIKTVRVHGA